MPGQIAFPATQSASAGANTLDDYEEGSWTPVIGGAGGVSGQTYTAQVGRYVKIGLLVMVQCYVELSAEGTITSSARIQGLPFTTENTTSLTAYGSLSWSNLSTTWVNINAVGEKNTTHAYLEGAKVAASSNNLGATASDIGDTTAFTMTLCYRATA